MKTIRYKKSDKEACLRVFESNSGKFFASSERQDFIGFLDNHAEDSFYYIVIDSDEVIACGGFELHDGKIILTWGMVSQPVHKQGIGTGLLMYRLSEARKVYGELEVLIDTSQLTKGFYSKFGFKILSIESNGYAQGLDKVYMSLSLKSQELQ